MEPIFSTRQLFQSAGQFLIVFLILLKPAQGFSGLTMDTLFEPIVEGLIAALGILGISRVGPGSTNGAGK